jgi:hypothetical protein
MPHYDFICSLTIEADTQEEAEMLYYMKMKECNFSNTTLMEIEVK